jgi:hypothetical protein
MASDKRKQDDEQDDDELDAAFDPKEYDTMLELERLESLEEEMMELGVTSLDDIRQRIGELHRTLDEERA